jgi:hypothetical protein
MTSRMNLYVVHNWGGGYCNRISLDAWMNFCNIAAWIKYPAQECGQLMKRLLNKCFIDNECKYQSVVHWSEFLVSNNELI